MKIALFVFVLATARQQVPESLFPGLPTFLSFLEFRGRNTAYVVVRSLIRTFFYPPVKIKSLIWEYFVYLRAYVVVEFFPFSAPAGEGGMTAAAAFHAGIIPKVLSRIQLV